MPIERAEALGLTVICTLRKSVLKSAPPARSPDMLSDVAALNLLAVVLLPGILPGRAVIAPSGRDAE